MQSAVSRSSVPDLLIQKSYWLRQFGSALPGNSFVHDLLPGAKGQAAVEVQVEIPFEVSQLTSALAAGSLLSTYLICLTALGVVLSRHSREKELIIASPAYRPDVRGQSSNLAIPVRLFVDPSLPFCDVLLKVRGAVLEAYAHAEPEIANLLAKTAFPLRDGRPVYPIIAEMEGIHAECSLLEFHSELRFRFIASGSRWSIQISYRADLYDETTMMYLGDHCVNALRAAVSNPHICVADIPIAAEHELNCVTKQFNRTSQPYNLNTTIAELFESQAQKAPDRIAVTDSASALSYGDLRSKAHRISGILRGAGVSARDVAAVLAPRSCRFVEGVVSAITFQLPFVAIDSDLPSDRILYFLRDSDARVLLASGDLFAKIESRIREASRVEIVLILDSPEDPIVNICSSSGGSKCARAGHDWAYLVYTSGSVSQPKGAVIGNAGALNHILAQAEELRLDHNTRFLQSAPASSDIIIWQLLAPLVLGGRIVLASREDVLDSAELFLTLKRKLITLAELVPASLQCLLEHVRDLPPDTRALPHLRCMMVTGEAISVETFNLWFTLFPDIPLVNCYGPAEASDDVCEFKATAKLPSNRARVPIGSPLPNIRLYTLDEQLRPAPLYVPGEICVGGVAVGAGYYNDPKRTAAAFVPDPFSEESFARLYRTGDLGRWLPNGTLEFLGRIDQQIKIRGNRIDPGEIEEILCADPAVQQSVVVACEGDGRKELAAYIVTTELAAVVDDATACEHDQVSHWQTVFGDTYTRKPRQSDPAFNIIGWNSAYTGLPIPATEMREWLRGTIDRLTVLRPRRVAEIGCGTGMLLLRLARKCEFYWASDFAPEAVAYVSKQVEELELPRDRIQLHTCAADDSSAMNQSSFDLVILNSVVQYFPSADYLLRVLDGLISRLTPGGYIFLGDVRSLPLLDAYHASIELQRASAAMRKPDFKRRVHNKMMKEEELVISPAWFTGFVRAHPQINGLSICPRRGVRHNELTKFRYDVILRIGSRKLEMVPAKRTWSTESFSTNACVRELLAEASRFPVTIAEIPNARLAQDVELLKLLETGSDLETVGAFRDTLTRHTRPAVDPETLWLLASEARLALDIDWFGASPDGRFDATFGPLDADLMASRLLSAESTFLPVAPLANEPLNSRFFARVLPRLRQTLQTRLPEYMVPSYFHRLESFPTTPGGKIDRNSLPAPTEMDRGLTTESFVAPHTPVETVIADVWQELLGVRRVGVNDNFFDLGGHSLLAAQVIARLRTIFQTELPLRRLFEAPTVVGLAKALCSSEPRSREIEKIAEIVIKVKGARLADKLVRACSANAATS